MRGMGNIPQMMMQGMMQGMSPMQKQAAPFLAGKTPQQMDQTAQNALQQSGVDPGAVAQQFQRFF